MDRVLVRSTCILSILMFLDRCGTGTVPLHLSTYVNVSLIPYRSVPIRDPVFCGARSGKNCSGIVWPAQFVMWTGGSVPFRDRYGRTRFRTDPNCTAPDVDRVLVSHNNNGTTDCIPDDAMIKYT